MSFNSVFDDNESSHEKIGSQNSIFFRMIEAPDEIIFHFIIIFSQRYEAFKHHWSETKLPVMLEITPFSLDQLDITTAQVLASYCYKDIKAIQDISDIPDGFVIIIAPDDRLVSTTTEKSLTAFALSINLHYFYSICSHVRVKEKYIQK